jgi:hypothetical protein
MPVQSLQQEVLVSSALVSDWGGGINTSVPPDRIADNEAEDITNFQFNQESNLVVRRGVTKFLGIAPSQVFGRITALHYHEDDAGNIHVLLNEGTKLWRINNLGTAFADITGVLVFPNDAIWQWKSFLGLAIGVNGATSGTNPVKFSAGTAAALGGTPPKAKYIEIWNSRVWVVDASNPNTLRASALGNAEDWTTAGAAGTITLDISKNDGDKITGLIAFRERLFVFKRTKIFIISAIANPITDANNLRVDIYSNNLGCVAANSIQPVLNDILFLSESGVASLISSEVVGNFNAAFLSRNINELSTYLKNDTHRIYSLVLDDGNQYWLSLPATTNPKGVNETYVLDYRNIQQGQVRWTKFDGRVSGSAATPIFVNGEKRYIIGSNTGSGNDYRPYLYQYATGNFNDDGLVVTRQLISKAYNMGRHFIRKLFLHWYINVINLTNPTVLDTIYRFDDDSAKQGNESRTLVNISTGAFWDTAVWDTDFWSGENVTNFRLKFRFQTKSFGRKAVKVQIIVTNSKLDQAFIVGPLSIDYAVLNERRGNNL